jgi:hypothetical protein
MSATFTRESENTFVVTINGVLAFDDMKTVERSARDQIDRTDKVRLLVLAGQFAGWGKGGDWGDLTFMYEFDPYIEKIAVVANETWKGQFKMFLRAGNRQAEVVFFASDQEDAARDWLRSSQK